MEYRFSLTPRLVLLGSLSLLLMLGVLFLLGVQLGRWMAAPPVPPAALGPALSAGAGASPAPVGAASGAGRPGTREAGR